MGPVWWTSERKAAGAVLLIVVAPMLAFDPAGRHPFGASKWLAVTVGVPLGLAALGVVTRWRAGWWAWSAFLAWAALTTVTGMDPIHGWLGTPDRHLGWVAWLVFFGAFVVGTSIDDRRVVAYGAIIALLAVDVWVLLEWIGRAPMEIATASERLGGPFGSAAYLGAALVLLVPLAFSQMLGGGGPRRWRWPAATSGLGGVAALVGTQTRGALLGLGAAGVVMAPAVYRRHGWRAVLVPVAVLSVAVIMSPLGDRLAGVVDPDEAGAGGRLAEWTVGLRVLAEHPVLGTGPEGYRIAFPTAVDAEYQRRYGREVLPDRAHNGLLDIGVAHGLVGLGIAGAAAMWLARSAARATTRDDAVVVGLAASVVGYLVQQQFLFPLAEIDPAFWLVAGSLLVATRPRPLEKIELPRWAVGSLVGVALGALLIGALDLAADRSLAEARRLAVTGDLAAARDEAGFAASLRPDSIRYAFAAADVAQRGGEAAGYASALAWMDRALAISPEDPLLRARRATLLLDLARAGGDLRDVVAARRALEEVAESDPMNAEMLMALGVARLATGDIDGAESAWLTASDLAPSAAAPLLNLAELYLDTDRPDAAAALIGLAERRGAPPRATAALRSRLDSR